MEYQIDPLTDEQEGKVLAVTPPITEEEIEREYKTLLSFIKDSKTVGKLDNVFDDITKHIKSRLTTAKYFKHEIASSYISSYTKIFNVLKSEYETKRSNIVEANRSFYRNGLSEDIDEAKSAIFTTNKYTLTTTRKLLLGYLIALILIIVVSELADKEFFAGTLYYSWTIAGIITFIIVMLKKDYKRFKASSKMWIFVIEVIMACIFVPIFLSPIVEEWFVLIVALLN